MRSWLLSSACDTGWPSRRDDLQAVGNLYLELCCRGGLALTIREMIPKAVRVGDNSLPSAGLQCLPVKLAWILEFSSSGRVKRLPFQEEGRCIY